MGLEVCIDLYTISSKQLYKAVGYNSFLIYVQKQRIDGLPPSTASEYTSIGSVYCRYKDKLDKYDFKPSDGIRKLLYLKNAEFILIDNEEEVYKNLKNLTIKEFKHFVANLVKGSLNDETTEREVGKIIQSKEHTQCENDVNDECDIDEGSETQTTLIDEADDENDFELNIYNPVKKIKITYNKKCVGILELFEYQDYQDEIIKGITGVLNSLTRGEVENETK